MLIAPRSCHVKLHYTYCNRFGVCFAFNLPTSQVVASSPSNERPVKTPAVHEPARKVEREALLAAPASARNCCFVAVLSIYCSACFVRRRPLARPGQLLLAQGKHLHCIMDPVTYNHHRHSFGVALTTCLVCQPHNDALRAPVPPARSLVGEFMRVTHLLRGCFFPDIRIHCFIGSAHTRRSASQRHHR